MSTGVGVGSETLLGHHTDLSRQLDLVKVLEDVSPFLQKASSVRKWLGPELEHISH